jgi:Zn-dependent metalloprotease
MTRLLVALLAGLLFSSGNAVAQGDVRKQIADLEAQDVRVKTHPRTGDVRLIGAWPQVPLAVPSVNEVTRAEFAGMAAVRHFGPMFGLTRPNQEVRRDLEEAKSGGGSRHRYRQLHKGIPVLAGELLVNLDEYRRVISMSGEISSKLDVDVQADINPRQAQRLALDTITKWYNVRQRPLRASVPELWIVDPKTLKPGDRDASLTWRIEVTDRQEPYSIRELLFIDANSGGVTLHINLIERLKNRETYTANQTASLPGALVCDENDPNCIAGDSEARNAHLFAGDTYDFFYYEHGRDSLDDAGQTLISTVNYSDFLCPNAFWNGSQMVYCTGLAVDDVVGHEFTHGITENTSQLLYYYESGAINESLSDIWGEFIDLGNGAGDDSPSARWLIGEDLTSTVGVIRNMANPPAIGDPDKMSSPYYWTSASDNGGVHFNSGINNKAAYLMTDGDSFNGYTVNGLGVGKVADIYYEAQTNLLTSGSDYADLHAALNQACQNLIGSDGITSADCLNVQAAVDAVEMDTDPQNFHPDAPVCIGGDPPDDLFFDNLENGTGRWNLINVSGSQTAAWIGDFGYAASGEFMLWGRDSFVSTDGTAEMNVDVPLPTNAKPYLHFKHSFAFEASYDFETFELAHWDGGFLEYSTDGGATWSDAGPLIDGGQAYNATIYDNPTNPNANHPAFGEESHGYVSTRLDLSPLVGQNVRFRWHTSTDGAVSGPFGWVIDDVRVYTCANEPPPPAEVAFSAATYSVSEAGGAATITVSRTGGANSSFSIDYSTTDLGASAGVDYAAANGTLYFTDGQNSQTFNVPVFEDGSVEGDETIVLTLGGGSGWIPGPVTEAILTINDNDSSDFAWVDDAMPVGATTAPAGATPPGSWNWVSASPAPYSGTTAHQSILADGIHQHYFVNATAPLQVQAGDILYAYVYLDPDNPPGEVMLQWNSGGSWEHRAYWGADLIDWGISGTESRRYMGPLPATGEWVRLEIPASAVGLDGAAINGMAFTLFDGRATWDTTGITSTSLIAKVAFSDATYSVSEAGVAATITVARVGSASDGFTVDFATADGSATAGVDYSATNGTLVFADNENSRTFSVSVIDDGLIEANESIVLTLSGENGAILGAVTEAVLTIADDDGNDVAWMDDALPVGATPSPSGAVPPGEWSWVSTSPIPYSGGLAHQSILADGAHQHYFTNAAEPLLVQTGDTLFATVYLDPANPPREVMLQWNAGGSWEHRAYWGENLLGWGVEGTNSGRYMGALPATGQWVRLEIPASVVGLEGAAVSGMAFTLFDGRATWDTTGATSTPSTATVAFSDAAYNVGEADVSALITVSRTGSTSGSATVDYTTADGSATSGIDYAATSGTLVFADGEDTQTFSVPVIDDGLIEANEDILLTLSGESGAILGAVSDALLTIADNDSNDFAWVDEALPAGATPNGVWNWISSAPAPYSGALAHQSTLADGFHQHFFTNATVPLQVLTGDTLYAYVYLDPANPPGEVMLQWNAGGSWDHRAYWGENLLGWGVEGTDSSRYMGPLPATGQWVRLEVPASDVGLEDTSVNGMAFTLFDGRATWDSAGVTSTPPFPKVSFSDATYSVSEAAVEAIITVNRTGNTGESVTVDYATADGTATAGSDYTATNGTLNFGIGEDSKTISVTVLEDGLVEGNETVELTLSGANGANLGALSEALLTITDNDSNDVAWFDDALPAGASPDGTWNWVSTAPAPYSGGLAHQSTGAVTGPDGRHSICLCFSRSGQSPGRGDAAMECRW